MCVCFASCYFLLLFFSTRVCCLFLLFLKTTHAKLDILFCFFSFFLRFVSSFEQSNGNCMILFTGFFFFCLLLLLKKWEMYHHIGLPFLKIQILLLSSYVPNMPSRSISVSFQIGHTKMDFFFLQSSNTVRQFLQKL